MSPLATLARVGAELLEHRELIELILDAVQKQNVDRGQLVAAIKAEITRQGAERLRRELGE